MLEKAKYILKHDSFTPSLDHLSNLIDLVKLIGLNLDKTLKTAFDKN